VSEQHPARHIIGHLGTIFSRQSIALVLTTKQQPNNTQIAVTTLRQLTLQELKMQHKF